VYIRRKRGLEPVVSPHPDLDEVLKPTYGVITYQEQVMRVANILAGFSLGESDVLRKAVGKKDAALTKKVLADFQKRAVERGVAKRQAGEIADLIQTFGRYGFPKAHSTAYAILSYRTAWLKAHHPAEFMAALLSSEIGNTDKVVAYIGAAREMGIDVLPPSVNESRYKFTVVDENTIRFGLGAVKGVGQSAIRSIIVAREEKRFESLFDFCERVDLRLNNKRVIEAMIGAGALDEFGERAQLTEGLETALSWAGLLQRERESGQTTLFGASDVAPEAPLPQLPRVEPWSEAERLTRERELLGFYTSGHPLDRFREFVDLYALEANSSNFEQLRERSVEVACVVREASVRTSRRDGREWCRLTIEDYHGTSMALVFGDVWIEYRDLLSPGHPILLKGTVSGRSRDDEDPPIFVDAVQSLADVRASGDIGVCIELRKGEQLEPGAIERLRGLLAGSPGNAPLLIAWRSGGGNGSEPPLLTSQSFAVSPSRSFLTELRELMGDDRVRLIRNAARR
jgi:DNA polymerase-3 subunit alpha